MRDLRDAGPIHLQHLEAHPQPRPHPRHLPLPLLVGQLPVLQGLGIRDTGQELDNVDLESIINYFVSNIVPANAEKQISE